MRHKCRCELCRRANAAYARMRHEERETLHGNLARGDDLEILDRSLITRGKALEAVGSTETEARLDEIIRLRTQIARVRRARDRARTAA
ncbi:hypothetical protein DEO23_14125 [Brachybacterium endophyticum]|uniref:Uncharacterized protein n=1 Tax=Brachybacterium endophyticum TaxID=2182385 RepID=A0A2U2RH64_9MICO|nr:hypothetical protein DEO23_14125 [Brachybacterium endophyticum]